MNTEKSNEENPSKAINPLIFISHDTRDADLAEAFSSLLKNVSAGVLKSFRSSDKKGTQGIEYGVEWYPEIIKNIQDATDVVCLLTNHSVDRPWILFEAGMAKGKLSTPILGLTLGISLKDASSGPFAQFQNCNDDIDSITKLVSQLVNRIPNAEPDEETVKNQVTIFKTKIDEILKKRKKENPSHKKENIQDVDNSSAKLFEEIKIMFQDLPARINFNSPEEYKYKKHRRFHPGMIDEFMHISEDPTIGFMMLLSLFKDSPLPWIYDIGIETVKQIKSKKNREEKERILYEFEKTIEISTHHPMIREFFRESKDDIMFFREMPVFLIKSLRRLFLN